MASGPSAISSVLFGMLWFRKGRQKWNARLKVPDFCSYLASFQYWGKSWAFCTHENTVDLFPSPLYTSFCVQGGLSVKADQPQRCVLLLRSNLISLVACKKYFEELNFFLLYVLFLALLICPLSLLWHNFSEGKGGYWWLSISKKWVLPERKENLITRA